MLRKLAGVVMVLVLAASGVLAEEKKEKKESGFASWLQSLQKKIERVTPKKDLSLSTSVAGVRGAKQDDKAKIYWKGKEGDEPVSEAELNDFKSAMALFEKGDADSGIKSLETFMKQNPDSALIPDVKKTLDMAKAEKK